MSMLKSTLVMCKYYGCTYLINGGNAGVQTRGKPAKARGGKQRWNHTSAMGRFYFKIWLVSAIKCVILGVWGELWS